MSETVELVDVDGTRHSCEFHGGTRIIRPIYSSVEGFVCDACDGSGEGQCRVCNEPHCYKCGGSGDSPYGQVVYARSDTDPMVFREESRSTPVRP